MPLNLKSNLRRIVILTILTFLILDYGVFLPFIMVYYVFFTFRNFSNVLYFSTYRPCSYHYIYLNISHFCITVHRTVLLMSFPNCSLLYRNEINYCMLISYPVTLPSSLIKVLVAYLQVKIIEEKIFHY